MTETKSTTHPPLLPAAWRRAETDDTHAVTIHPSPSSGQPSPPRVLAKDDDGKFEGKLLASERPVSHRARELLDTLQTRAAYELDAAQAALAEGAPGADRRVAAVMEQIGRVDQARRLLESGTGSMREGKGQVVDGKLQSVEFDAGELVIELLPSVGASGALRVRTGLREPVPGIELHDRFHAVHEPTVRARLANAEKAPEADRRERVREAMDRLETIEHERECVEAGRGWFRTPRGWVEATIQRIARDEETGALVFTLKPRRGDVFEWTSLGGCRLDRPPRCGPCCAIL